MSPRLLRVSFHQTVSSGRSAPTSTLTSDRVMGRGGPGVGSGRKQRAPTAVVSRPGTPGCLHCVHCRVWVGWATVEELRVEVGAHLDTRPGRPEDTDHQLWGFGVSRSDN